MDKKRYNNFYNRRLKGLARSLRKSSTKGEIMLWIYVLRARQLRGYQFLRQRIINDYIVDFFCKDLKLIIEVDGLTHIDKKKEDGSKDSKLSEHGYNIIRIPDFEIFSNLAMVKEKLENWIDEYEENHPGILKNHPPNPLQRGKGN